MWYIFFFYVNVKFYRGGSRKLGAWWVGCGRSTPCTIEGHGDNFSLAVACFGEFLTVFLLVSLATKLKNFLNEVISSVTVIITIIIYFVAEC